MNPYIKSLFIPITIVIVYICIFSEDKMPLKSYDSKEYKAIQEALFSKQPDSPKITLIFIDDQPQFISEIIDIANNYNMPCNTYNNLEDIQQAVYSTPNIVISFLDFVVQYEAFFESIFDDSISSSPQKTSFKNSIFYILSPKKDSQKIDLLSDRFKKRITKTYYF